MQGMNNIKAISNDELFSSVRSDYKKKGKKVPFLMHLQVNGLFYALFA
jgi:hypothetical protein